MTGWRILAGVGLAALAACGGEDAREPVLPEDEQPTVVESEAEELTAIPEAYHGRWDFAVADCEAATSEGRLEVSAEVLDYYESAATVERVAREEPGSIVVHAQFSGEGETWTERLALEVNEDGDRLTVTTPEGDVSIRMRCP